MQSVSHGFLGTSAPFSADVNLILQLAMAAALLAGAWLARRKLFAAHGICQATVLLLNLVPIATVMWPSFHGLVLPRFAKHLHSRFYLVATMHGTLGIIAELFGLYIALVAGTNLVPRRLRFNRWKLWMRFELALWWVVLISGVVTYGVWYGVPHLP